MKLWAMPCRATQDGRIVEESSDKTWSTGRGNGRPLQYSCLENPMNYEKAKRYDTHLLHIPKILLCTCHVPVQIPQFLTIILFASYMVYGAFVVQSLSHVWFCNPKGWSTTAFPVLHHTGHALVYCQCLHFLIRKAEVQRDSSVTESCTDNQGQSQENWSPDDQCLVCYIVSLCAAWLPGWCHVLLQ